MSGQVETLRSGSGPEVETTLTDDQLTRLVDLLNERTNCWMLAAQVADGSIRVVTTGTRPAMIEMLLCLADSVRTIGEDKEEP